MAANHDYEGFYKKEIATRKFAGFPPYNRLIKFTFRAGKEEKAQRAAEELAERLKGFKGTKILGPAPSPVIRIRGQFRWNVFLKFKEGKFPSLPSPFTHGRVESGKKGLGLQLRGVVAEFKKGRGAFMTVDVDPVNI
jgi:hypothetical protein